MSHVVAKTIHTAISRLAVGQPVAADDYLLPHSFDDLLTRGFIKPAPALSASPASVSPVAPVKAAAV